MVDDELPAGLALQCLCQQLRLPRGTSVSAPLHNDAHRELCGHSDRAGSGKKANKAKKRPHEAGARRCHEHPISR
jgi:hypothetical protein